MTTQRERPSIQLAQPNLSGREKEYVMDCLESGWISSQGEYVTRFAEAFSSYLGISYSLPTSNGTTALHLALTALGVGPGDEVLVPNLTFGATANAVLHCGAQPVLVDINADSWAIDPAEIAEKVTSRTKVLIVVHLYGRPAPMTEIMAIARQYGLKVIEDCAESLGARYKNRMTGSDGDISCFSFFANKIMTTGEGGMVVTSNAMLFEKMQLLRDHGMSKERRYWHVVSGFNYRMTNIQAAIGLAQLEQIDDFLLARRNIDGLYRKYLEGVEGLALHQPLRHCEEVNWLQCVRFSDSDLREKALSLLNHQNVQARRFFYPLHLQPAFAQSGTFPVAENIAESGLCLPTYVGLCEPEIAQITQLIAQALSLEER